MGSCRLLFLVFLAFTFLRVTPAMSDSMTIHHSNTGYEPNSINTTISEMDTSGARFVPLVDLTHADDDTKSHMSDVPLQLPASANVSSTNSALVTHAGSDLVPNVHSLQPMPNQTSANLWQSQYPATYPQLYLQFLDHKKPFNWLHNEHEKL